MKSVSLFIGLTAVFFWGCKKEPLPVASSGEPVFYVSCAVNGIPLKLEAGNNGYMMEPGFSMDSNNVYVLEAQMKNPSCPSCYALKVLINDHMTSIPGEPIHIDSALKIGHYLFNDRSLEPTQYYVKLKPEIDEDLNGGSYKWTISEPNKADLVYSGYTLSLPFNALTEYTITCEYGDATGCSKSHSNLLTLGAGPEVDVSATRLSTTEILYKFSATSSSSPIQTYYWDFGDGQTSTDSTPEHHFDVAGGDYQVTLRAKDAAGKETISYYQVAGVVETVCTSNYDAIITPVPNTQAYSKITVELTEPSGKVYSTRDFIQPAESSFEIVSIEDYKHTAEGLKTKRFKVLFNCLLKTGGDELRITGGEAVLAVAYE